MSVRTQFPARQSLRSWRSSPVNVEPAEIWAASAQMIPSRYPGPKSPKSSYRSRTTGSLRYTVFVLGHSTVPMS